ncbi:hypothetical protein B279_09120 [Streptococcus equinus ATCC 33317]|uniref:plasmid mobilization protein n=1 Tax=Streptococcus equinus TaxID=1335 RepID=UPI000505F0C1|nr:hypothetical protein [Streptococcus equinus]KFN85302.1 hypothetical protein B279_09120 [Streptococcus equinus ATCC 33317]
MANIKGYQINIRVSIQEKETLDKEAEKQGLKRSEYIRSKLFSESATKSVDNDIQMYTDNIDKLFEMNQQLIENDKIKSETINNLTKLFNEEQKKTLALTQELESEKSKTIWQRLFRKR